MEWYIPITILPGVALLILSTSNFIIALNVEVKELKGSSNNYEKIISLKITQLKKLSYSISGLYICSLLFTFAGLLAALPVNDIIIFSFLIVATCFMSVAIIVLIVYALKAIKIRETHLNIKHG